MATVHSVSGGFTNAPGKNAYPISSFTWLLIPEKFKDGAKRDACGDHAQGDQNADHAGGNKLAPRRGSSGESGFRRHGQDLAKRMPG